MKEIIWGYGEVTRLPRPGGAKFPCGAAPKTKDGKRHR